MAQKFGRNYKLTITPNDGQSPAQIVIQPPLTCRFWVKRDILSSTSNASVDIYNLSEANRRRIFQDRNSLGIPANGKIKTARLDIGYGNELHTVWNGAIWTASTTRQGVDLVTRLESLLGLNDLVQGPINITLPAGQTLSQVFRTLAGALAPSIPYGFISDFPQVFTRPVVLSGQPWDLIINYAQAGAVNACSAIDAFIDNNKIYIMSRLDKLAYTPTVPVINSASGLLETPRREQTYMVVNTLLQSDIQLNSVVQFESTVEPAYNSQCAVVGLQHIGIISGAVSGEARSTFFLLKPDFASYNMVKSA
jgi:baseplate hub protein gp41